MGKTNSNFFRAFLNARLFIAGTLDLSRLVVQGVLDASRKPRNTPISTCI